MSEAVLEATRVAPRRTMHQESSAPAKRVWTADDLLAMPDDGQRYELVEGDLIVMTPASARHGKLAARLIVRLGAYVEENELGELYTAEPGFELKSDPDTVRAPDVAFVSRERIPAEGEPEGFWAIAPDLVVEIASPSESAPTIQGKVTDYLEAGTRLVWVVYPDTQTVMEFRSLTEIRVLTVDQDLEGGDVVPSFRLPLSRLFA